MTARAKTSKSAKTAKRGKPAKRGKTAKPARRRAAAKPRAQFAALPYRVAEGVEILVITSRETGRWVIPKGWPMKGRTPSEAAALEAIEEAGVTGEIAAKPLGSYPYVKYLKSGAGRPCKVKVFALRVTGQAEDWPEKGQRELRWLAWSEAAAAVQELRLGRLIRRFGKKAARGWTG
ncbi:MAG: NUDIX hydrolase [Caulobacteraceae bacterium]